MKIFKAELWNLDALLSLFEQYRLTHNMIENPERTLIFLSNRIRFSESIFFLAVDNQQNPVGFIELYPRFSSLQLQRYWQLNDIFVKNTQNKSEIYTALIAKAKEFVSYTQSTLLVMEQNLQQPELLIREGFKLNRQKSIFELNLI